MSSITAYMQRMGFGDYHHADAATREEMEAAALEFAAWWEPTSASVWRQTGIRQSRERYKAGHARAIDLMTLEARGDITAEQAEAYRQAHGWTSRKYGRG